MIDIENMVFDKVFNDLSTALSDMTLNITDAYDEANATFPTVVVRETGNIAYRGSATDASSENHARVTYEIEVYSDKISTGRSECKKILNAVDTIMQSMKFRRIHKNRPININRTIWRQYARYEVIVEKGYQETVIVDGKPVVNTIYQMYRR